MNWFPLICNSHNFATKTWQLFKITQQQNHPAEKSNLLLSTTDVKRSNQEREREREREPTSWIFVFNARKEGARREASCPHPQGLIFQSKRHRRKRNGNRCWIIHQLLAKTGRHADTGPKTENSSLTPYRRPATKSPALWQYYTSLHYWSFRVCIRMAERLWVQQFSSAEFENKSN